AVDWLIRASGRMAWVSILFFGGEPLLEFDLIRFVVGYSRDRAQAAGKEARFSMTTNGTLMTEEMARYLAEQRITYLLSLDGSRETHDAQRKLVGGGSSFEEVMARLPMMKRYQPWQGSRVTLHPTTVHRLREEVELLYRQGINQFIIGPATGIEWTDDALGEYERQMLLVTDLYVEKQRQREPFRMTLYEKDLEGRDIRNEWGCGAGRGRICISVTGVLYGCAKILGVDGLSDAHRLGDVWTGIVELSGRRELLNTHPSSRPMCEPCEFAGDCTGGCPAVNFEATGSLLSPAPLECRLAPIVRRIREHYRAQTV
ncbi:MAG: SPASM domain-containing protein, partial [Armatimonadetes bacterium]|nr:SPASM domain-containing protein [Armatimonadota bacterium]